MTNNYFIPNIPKYTFGEGGKKVVITAGIHGDETGAIYAAYKIIEEAKKNPPKNVQLIVFPLLNFSGFLNRKREWYDYTDLNRQKEEFHNHSLVGEYYKEVYKEAIEADLYIDLHTLTKATTSTIIYFFKESSKKHREIIYDFLSNSSFGLIEEFDEPKGPLTLAYEIYSHNVPTVMFELNNLPAVSTTQFDKEALNIFQNINKMFGNKIAQKIPLYGPKQKSYANFPGIFSLAPNIKAGMKVKKGQKVADFINVITAEIENIITATSGTLHYIHFEGAVCPGDEFFVIAGKKNN